MKCACCGYYTIEGMADVCPVCFWQKDVYQEENIDDDGGPNNISFREAAKKYKSFGVIDEQFRSYVRQPRNHEIRL